MLKPQGSSPHIPQAFQGAPGIGQQRMGQQAARVVEVAASLPRSVAQLTVHADGYVQPNAEAATLLAGPGLCFYPPAAVRPGCRPQLWQVETGECHLYLPRADKPGQVRLRAAGKCPPAGRYLFTPVAGNPARFALVPTV